MLRLMLRTTIIGFIMLPLFAQVLYIDKNHHFSEKIIISIIDIISTDTNNLHASAASTLITTTENEDATLNLKTLSLPCSENFECIIKFQINGKETLEDSDIETIVYYQRLFKKTITKIPSNLWKSLNKITFSFEKNITRGVASSSQIRLRIVNITDEQFVAVSIHEIGHLADLCNKNQDNFISGYSKTDCFEQFAETFLSYTLHPELLKYRNLDQYNYFKDEVFDELEYDNLSLVSDYDDYFYDTTMLPYDLDSIIGG